MSGKEGKVISFKIDCPDCDGEGKRQFGEGIHKDICPTCNGKGELELSEQQIGILTRYLELRDNGTSDAVARMVITEGQTGKSEFCFENWKSKKDISAFLDRISIAYVPELRQFLKERLKKR